TSLARLRSSFTHFLTYSSAAPRHLHSFPTRRSSDLSPMCWRLVWTTGGRRRRCRVRSTGSRPMVVFPFWRHHCRRQSPNRFSPRSEEHTSELQSRENLVCRLLLEKKKIKNNIITKQC